MTTGGDIDDTIGLVGLLGEHGVDVIDCSTGGLAGRPAGGVGAPAYSYQTAYAEDVSRRTGMPSMAVGLIVHARQASSIVETGQADFVALGRELLNNPNWPWDAARKLGIDDPYAWAPPRIAHWLRRRDETVPDLVPSTYTDGAVPARGDHAMRAAWYDRAGDARDVLHVGRIPDPGPGPARCLFASSPRA
ncbi:hypothetical protein QSJ19_25895 [Gordonia sp. ABSL11-1]|nr:hypothetical protein [Gordonia sp. ABSL11-1]MDL9948949.1 hypothetical protein [Gordonia sp. ABSL11-1]